MRGNPDRQAGRPSCSRTSSPGLEQGEQILVRGLAGHRRDRARRAGADLDPAVLADSPDQTEPGGAAAASVTWKGHLSKFTGFNCLPEEGPQTSRKYGVATVRSAPGAAST